MSDRRERRLQETRERIVTALETYLSQGRDDGISVDQLCELADVARQTFYNHFSGIEQLYMELTFVHIVARDTAQLEQAGNTAKTQFDLMDIYCQLGIVRASEWGWLEWNLLNYTMKVSFKMTQESADIVRDMIKVRNEILYGKAFPVGQLDNTYTADILGEFTKGVETGIVTFDSLKFLDFDKDGDINQLSIERSDAIEEMRKLLLELINKHTDAPQVIKAFKP